MIWNFRSSSRKIGNAVAVPEVVTDNINTVLTYVLLLVHNCKIRLYLQEYVKQV
jgi:hypothetical protein